jgi:thymidylate synthase ThyX
MHLPKATVVADSISAQGKRLITFQLQYWRPIHSELMTHRVFSRSAGSSRARPVKAIIEQVRNDPWGPLHWGKNQPGMQASEELTGDELIATKAAWLMAAKRAADSAEEMLTLNLHKQATNRTLEPYTYIDVVVTSTSYNNWYALRNHPAAQPEIRFLAETMKAAAGDSEPTLLQPGEWHLPFILFKEIQQYGGLSDPDGILRRISTARCARTSYKSFDGTVATVAQDSTLFSKLMADQPLHASPAEHPATPDTQSLYKVSRLHPVTQDEELIQLGLDWDKPNYHGNLDGWIQFRKLLPNEYVPG